MFLRRLLSVVSLFLLLSQSAFAQSDSCEYSLAFCTTTSYTFPASTNTTAQSGPDYDCLASQPNPAWYHMKIAVDGDINIKMSSEPLRDIDFMCWGPFDEAYSPCAAELTSSTFIDCSYAPDSVENCNIPNGLIGEYYILVITNYSNQECDITFEKSSGTGETDCTIVPPPVSNNGPLCVGDTLELYAGTVENTTYSWTGPDGFASTEQNPIIPNVTVSNDGSYSLVVVTAGSTSDPTYTNVIVAEYPNLDFTIDVNDTVCSNELITFTGTDANGTSISSWDWTFGDGNSATNQIVQHTYNIGGYFNTTLIAINNGNCTDTASMYIDVVANLSSNVGSNESICQGGVFDISTSNVLPDTSNCDSLLWIGGLGSFNDSGSLYPIYFPAPIELGNIQLGLIAYAAPPCDNDTNYMTLTIDSIPDVTFIIIPNDTVCIDELVTFNGLDNSGTTITSWQWDFGDGNTDNTQNTNNTYSAVLVDSVRLIAINDNTCTDTTYRDIWVTDPLIGSDINPKPACIGSIISFEGTGDVVNYTNWNWDFGDGHTDIGRDVSHLYSTSDTFEVTLNVCSKTVFDSAFVMPQAVADAGSAHTLCESLPFDFATSVTQPTAVGYDSLRWDGGLGNFNNPKIILPVYTPAIDEAGPIQFALVAYGKSPCSNDTSYVTITYNTLPDPGYIQLPIDSICVNEIISFTDTSTTNVQIWQWDFGDGNVVGLQNPDHSYITSGIFNLKFIVTNDKGCSDSIITPIQVHELPEPNFTILPNDTICSELPLTFDGFDMAGTTITNWNWDFGDGNQSTGQYVTHTYLSSGDYTITLDVLNNNSCTETDQKNVHISSLPESSFTISPNDTSCVSEMIFVDAIDITGDITLWDWQFGDGNIGTGQNVTHTYNQEGNFNILSIYQNAFGCIDTTTHQRVVQSVTIDFDIIKSPSCQDYSVQFTGTDGLVTFTDWIWDFGDGSPTGFGHTISHLYTTPDTVDVILNVCSEQMVQQQIIYPTCIVDAGSDEATCENVYFDLSTSSTPPSADGYSSVYWYTSGLGAIDDPTLISPTYIPDSVEGSIQVDTVYMTMVGYGFSPCDNDTSQMMILVVPGAYAEAGSDENSCVGYPFDLASSTDSVFAANYIVLYWLTSGTGYFVDPNVEQPIYIPGPNELGPVTLTMVASNIINCDSIDEMILTIRPEYVMSFDTTICHNDSLFVQGSWHYLSGTYYDTLQSEYGCDSVIITNLTVRPKIDQDFVVATSDSICYGETVDFVSTGSAILVNWLWDFGDGYTSNNINPTHQYDTSGYFTVIYYYTDDNGCSDSSTNQVMVFELPEVWFTNNMTNPCVNTQIDFVGSSNHTIVSWQWDFGGGNVGTGQNISHTYTTWGNMTIELIVTDTNGCSEITYQFMDIAEPPIADFTYNSIICDSIQFTDLSSCAAGYNIVRWYWVFGDGTTDTLQNPTHQYPHSTTPGGEEYNVSLLIIADSSGYECADSVELLVVVPNLPDVFYSFDPDPSCFGETTYFFGESTHNIDVWSWDFGDATFSMDQNPSHLYADTGSYYVTLSLSDNVGCINSLTNQVVVNPLPDVTFTMDPSFVCVNTPVYYFGQSNSNIALWNWDYGDGQSGIGQNTSHAYTTWGNIVVSLMVTDIFGCSESAFDNIYIPPPPIAN
ncbi:MAG: PKD domain-containing protein, partial [Bacteroidota bacterium]